MKKATFFGLIAILIALVSLTGCDEILEVFYPEFGSPSGGDGGDDGAYGIGVYVEVAVPEGDFDAPQIAGMVESLNGDRVSDLFVTPNENLGGEGELILSAYLDFVDIPQGEYRVIVWLERTAEGAGNEWPDFDEPQREAVWFPPNEQEPSNVFPLPFNPQGTDEQWGWIEGEAFLSVFEGTAVNRDFDIDGRRVVNVNDLSTDQAYNAYEYRVFPLASEAGAIVEINHTLWGPEGDMDSGIVSFAVGDAPTFTMNFTDYPPGEYWLDVEIVYEDDWREYKGFPLRFISNELSEGDTYNVNVFVNDADLGPLSLPTGEDVYWEMKIPLTETEVSTEYGWSQVSTETFALPIEVMNLMYNETEPNVVDGATVDVVDIAIDMNNNDTIEAGDFYTRLPLGVSYDDLDSSDTWVIDIWGGDFRPVF